MLDILCVLLKFISTNITINISRVYIFSFQSIRIKLNLTREKNEYMNSNVYLREIEKKQNECITDFKKINLNLR